MGLGETEVERILESSAALRLARLPLVKSALQSLTSAYSQVKGRHPLLQLLGGVAEGGVARASNVALQQATPLLLSLEPQLEVANSLVLLGLDRLEQNFPILQQSTDEVVGHLKDALFLTLDDLQLWLVDGVDVALERLERVSELGWSALRQVQDSQVGRVASSGLDDVLSRLEEATAHYLPLPPTLRLQWEKKVQQYEEEDEDEPSVWTRVRSLVLVLVLQIYHRLLKTRDQLQRGLSGLQSTADAVGVGRVVELLGDLLQYVQSLVVALLFRAEGVREEVLVEIRTRTLVLVQWTPVQRVLDLPDQIQNLLRDLQELSKLLLQLVINATPLYNMLQQPSEQEVEDFLNQHDFTSNCSSRRSSGNASSLFLKAMDGRPRRRRSLYSLAARGPQSPEPKTNTEDQEVQPPPANNGPAQRRPSANDSPAQRRPSANESPAQRRPSANEVPAHRRPSATEMLLAPLKQFVTQSQKAFEYLSPNSPEEATPVEQEQVEE